MWPRATVSSPGCVLQGDSDLRRDLFLRESGKVRQHALPLPIALHKNICGPLLRAEVLSHEFTPRASQCRNNRAISINADPEIFGFHHIVRQGARFDDLEKTRPVNYFSVRVNDDPVICDKSSDAFKIVLNDCL